MAHDRVGFGAAVALTGLVALTCVWCGRASRALWETLAVTGAVSLTAAIAGHLVVGYVDVGHLVPVVAAAGAMLLGLALTRATWTGRSGLDPAGRDHLAREAARRGERPRPAHPS
ncbi:hypothetical protein GCM10010123_17480 [Pilimelia anulata]|uniref:Uncharacterized protein n=1 Tax=Pilimelia anulata TaxID=53371 RepID=A0A8J3F8E4_9ACTN|nr:hypothetical protein [Pilimelia anulata]GGJ88400.1 hypothetical protein GCM10010123_17480 [Pilimelia anulata]